MTGERLKEVRNAPKAIQQMLPDKLHVSKSTIQSWEQEKCPLPLAMEGGHHLCRHFVVGIAIGIHGFRRDIDVVILPYYNARS